MRSFFVLLSVSLAQAAPSAREEADRLLLEAKKLSDAGKYEEAISRFRAAEQLLPRAIHDCNLGLAYAKLKKPAQSVLYLESCRARASEKLPDWVSTRIAATIEELKKDHVPLDLSSEPPGARVTVSSLGAENPFVVPRRVWVPKSAIDVSASLPGYEDQTRHLDVKSEQALRFELRKPEPPKPKPEPVAIAPSPAPVVPPVAVVEKQPVVVKKDTTRIRRVAGGVLLGVGLGLLLAGMVTNLIAVYETKPDAERFPQGTEFQSKLDTFHLERDQAIACYAIGGAASVAGLGTLISLKFK